MSTAGRRRVVIIGIGNPWRHDDGAGWVTADVAGARLGPDAAVVVQSDGEPARLIDAWTDADLAVVVDAVRTGAAPGTIHHVEAVDAMNRRLSDLASSHGLGLGDAVRLGRAVGQLPRRLMVFGIEAADVSAGRGFSSAVAGAVQTVAHSIERAVRAPNQESG
jgi:hydrogenase maturation protease